MRDKVVGLENKADTLVAVGVPVYVVKFLCGNAVNLDVATGVAIKSANDIKKCGLATARRA